METDARGQLGGLDTSDAVRRRLAAESKGWRCAACARSNAEIIAETEERCRELDSSGGGAEGSGGERQEVEVPAELKLGFRDEMEKAKAQQQAGEGEGEKEDAESAELAEGFVQTAPEREIPAPPPARPAQGVPAPTGRIPLPDPVGQAAPIPTPTTTTATQSRRPIDPNAGVPAWVDYAIVSLVVILIAMLMKILVGR